MWDLIVSVPDHCLSFYFNKIPANVLGAQTLCWFCHVAAQIMRIRNKAKINMKRLY